MPTGYTYDSYQAAIATQIPTVITDPNFVLMLPNSIDYAELSIQRDLDFLSMHGNVPLTATPGRPYVYLPSGIIVLEELYFTTTTYLLDGNGNQILDGNGNPIILSQYLDQPISPLSQAALRAIYSTAPGGPPQYFSVIGSATNFIYQLDGFGSPILDGSGNPIILDGPSPSVWTPGMRVLLGPTPDQAYAVTAYVTARQPTLSADNEQTFISMQLPDLFWSASMIFWSGWLKNFGAQGYADDPGMSINWSKEYQRLLKGAQVEEARKKFTSSGWTAQFPTPIAAQPRAAA